MTLPLVTFLGLTEITDASQHRSYNAWHQLDHLPEQLPLPGLLSGQRWVSTPACTAARLVAVSDLAPAHYLTSYLMGPPVQETLDAFAELADRLRNVGRMHGHRTLLLSGAYQFLDVQASPRVLVSPAAVLHRPNRGVYVVIEQAPASTELDAHLRWLHAEHVPRLLQVPGVAGVASFASDAGLARPGWVPGDRRVTFLYLDDDPVGVADAVRPLVEERWRRDLLRPELAGPFQTVVPWEWDWFDEPA